MRSRKGEPQLELFNLNEGRKPVTKEVCFICACAYCSSLSVLFEKYKYERQVYIIGNRKYLYKLALDHYSYRAGIYKLTVIIRREDFIPGSQN